MEEETGWGEGGVEGEGAGGKPHSHLPKVGVPGKHDREGEVWVMSCCHVCEAQWSSVPLTLWFPVPPRPGPVPGKGSLPLPRGERWPGQDPCSLARALGGPPWAGGTAHTARGLGPSDTGLDRVTLFWNVSATRFPCHTVQGPRPEPSRVPRPILSPLAMLGTGSLPPSPLNLAVPTFISCWNILFCEIALHLRGLFLDILTSPLWPLLGPAPSTEHPLAL